MKKEKRDSQIQTSFRNIIRFTYLSVNGMAVNLLQTSLKKTTKAKSKQQTTITTLFSQVKEM